MWKCTAAFSVFSHPNNFSFTFWHYNPKCPPPIRLISISFSTMTAPPRTSAKQCRAIRKRENDNNNYPSGFLQMKRKIISREYLTSSARECHRVVKTRGLKTAGDYMEPWVAGSFKRISQIIMRGPVWQAAATQQRHLPLKGDGGRFGDAQPPPPRSHHHDNSYRQCPIPGVSHVRGGSLLLRARLPPRPRGRRSRYVPSRGWHLSARRRHIKTGENIPPLMASDSRLCHVGVLREKCR